MRVAISVLSSAFLLWALPSAASAVSLADPIWQNVETLELVRGIADPDVAIDDHGTALAVYSNVDDPVSESPQVKLAARQSGGVWRVVKTVSPGAVDARIAVNPEGATAIAAVEGGRLYVTVYPAPGPAGNAAAGGVDAPTHLIDAAGTTVSEPRIGIDRAGVATVVWSSPATAETVGGERRIRAVTVAPTGTVGDVRALGMPGACAPEIDVNLAGAAVVSGNCSDQAADVFYRPAGGVLGLGEDPFGRTEPIGVSIDGAGNVHAYLAGDYAFRQADGSFSTPQRIPVGDFDARSFKLVAFEDGRVIAGWTHAEEGISYAVKAPDAPFGAPTPLATRGPANGFDVVGSSSGPALISWRESRSPAANPVEQPATVTVQPDGSASSARLGIRGDIATPVARPLPFAIAATGAGAGVWEQRCSSAGAWAVTAVALDTSKAVAKAPCQDTLAPKVIAAPKRARLGRRAVRVRIACDERCRLTASARVMRQGHRGPLATAKTARERRLSARSGAWIDLRLSSVERRRLASALRARRKVTVRLAVSVRDVYGNGTRRRLAVPLAR